MRKQYIEDDERCGIWSKTVFLRENGKKIYKKFGV